MNTAALHGPLPGVFDGRCIEPVDYRFTVTIDAAETYDELTWSLYELALTEVLGQPFHLIVTLAVTDMFFEVDRLVGGRCVLEFGRGAETRSVVGVILRAGSAGATDDHLLLRVEAGPVIAPLGLVVRSRVFRNSTAVEIVRDVVGPTLAAADGTLDVSRLADHGVIRDHCVQYRESDLAFASRLLAEEGISYVIDDTTMILLDRVDAFAAVGRPSDAPVRPLPWVPVVPSRQEEARTESVQSLARARAIARNRWRSSAWDWKSSSPSHLTHEARGDEGPQGVLHGSWHDERRLYESDEGNGPAIDDGDARLARRMDHERSRSILVQGESNHSGFAPARSWELAEHPHRELDDEYVIVSVTHRGVCPRPGVPEAERQAPRYTNAFVALPRSVPYRPTPPEKPRIYGIQTALVVGPPAPHDPNGEPPSRLPTRVHTDEHGRVLLRHGWDENGQDTCWVRVAETSEFAFSTPRIGTEVVVAFVDGDPDRPLVVGVVHNGERRHPEPRPEEATRMGWKTLSSPSGDGYNEISLEDADGREEIRVHAERDLNTRIRRNETRRVGDSQSIHVGRDRTDAVGRDEKRSVGRNREMFIDEHDFTHVKGTQTVFILGEKEANGRNGSFTSVEHGPFVMRAADEIRIECGNSNIVLRPDRIEIHSKDILLKSTNPDPAQRTATQESLVHLHPGGLITNGETMRMQTKGALLVADRRSLNAVGGSPGRRSALQLDGDARLDGAFDPPASPPAPSGRVIVHAKTDAEIRADGTLNVSSKDVIVCGDETVTIGSNGDTTISSTAGTVTVKGMTVEVN